MSAVVDAKTGEIVAWKDVIPFHYEYTAGTAGEAFLRGLKDGKIVASKCSACGEVRVPPRAYCLECGERTRVDVYLDQSGCLAAVSTAHVNGEGRPIAASDRITFGYVTFEGIAGGMVHRVLHAGRRDPKVGDLVTPFFVPRKRREGSILDLEGFRTGAKK